MKITQIENLEGVDFTRADIVAAAKENIKEFNNPKTKDGNYFVHVQDAGYDVSVNTKSIIHGIYRTSSVNSIVTASTEKNSAIFWLML